MDETMELLSLPPEELARRIELERRLLADPSLDKDVRARLEQNQAQLKEERIRYRKTMRRKYEALRQRREEYPLQKFLPFLEACHSFSLAAKVQANLLKSAKGEIRGEAKGEVKVEAINSIGQRYPQQIIPWEDFQAKQNDIWNQLASFADQCRFPSQYKCDSVRSQLQHIRCEQKLWEFEVGNIENAVHGLIKTVNEDSLLRDSLGLHGIVTFSPHPARDVEDHGDPVPFGDVTHTNHFCVYETSDGPEFAKTAIQNISPQELTQDMVIEGLVSEIRPYRDVINKSGKNPAQTPKARAAAAVTQLFSRMVDKGIQYGYLCIGQTYVFLFIPDNPAIVYYHVSVPDLDVRDDDESRFYKTAVGQVFAFVLQSLRMDSPPQAWYDAAEKLSVWPVESEDVRSRVHGSVCEGREPRASTHKAQRRREFTRSPIRTRSSDKQPEIKSGRKDSNDDALNPLSHGSTHSLDSRARQTEEERPALRQGVARHRRIQDRLYCTNACLLGLAYGGPIDKTCPNNDSHGPKHISRLKFLRLLRSQLANDRGPDADIIPLHLSGAMGALFKVRLSAYGYTLVAKGVKQSKLERLEHEKEIYDQLRPIQGQHVAVCLGLASLISPYYYNGLVFEHFLFLSWAGRPLKKCAKELSEEAAMAAVTKAFKCVHQLQVLHGDAEVRNITYDKAPMIVDFDSAKLCRRQPLGTMSQNNHNGKRKRDVVQKQGSDVFARELKEVKLNVSWFYQLYTLTCRAK